MGLVIHRAQVKGCVLVPTGEACRHTQVCVYVLLQPSFVLVPSTGSLLRSRFHHPISTLNVLAHFYPSPKMLSHFLSLCAYLTESYMPSKTSLISFFLKTESLLKICIYFFPLLHSDVLGMLVNIERIYEWMDGLSQIMIIILSSLNCMDALEPQPTVGEVKYEGKVEALPVICFTSLW